MERGRLFASLPPLEYIKAHVKHSPSKTRPRVAVMYAVNRVWAVCLLGGGGRGREGEGGCRYR